MELRLAAKFETTLLVSVIVWSTLELDMSPWLCPECPELKCSNGSDANSFMLVVARWQALVSWLCLVTPTCAFLASPFVAARTHLMSAAVDNFATELELVLHPQLKSW